MQTQAYQTFAPNCQPNSQFSATTGACSQPLHAQVDFLGLPGVSCSNCWLSLAGMSFVVVVNYVSPPTGLKEFNYEIKLTGPIAASLGLSARLGLPQSSGKEYTAILARAVPFNQFVTTAINNGKNVGQCLFPGLTYKANLKSLRATLTWTGSAPAALASSLTTYSPSAGLFMSNIVPFSSPIAPLVTVAVDPVDSSGKLLSLRLSLEASFALEVNFENSAFAPPFTNYGTMETIVDVNFGGPRRLSDTNESHVETAFRQLQKKPKKQPPTPQPATSLCFKSRGSPFSKEKPVINDGNLC